MEHWALDLGTTNSALALWDADRSRPTILRLEDIVREGTGIEELGTPNVVPTATHVVHEGDLWTQLGRLPFVHRHTFWGRHGYIGRQALERNISRIHSCYVPSVKPYLQAAALQPVARVGKRSYTAREVVRIFFRELFAEVYRQRGKRIRELTVTAPVDAYEAYRAELRDALRSVGVDRIHFVDEPVAAAAGYGLSVSGRRNVLVVDFGGGTLDIAWVTIDPKAVLEGQCTVVAKAGRPIGGNVVDRWLLDAFLDRLEFRIPVEEDQFWHRLMIQEARWVKESIYFRDAETFFLKPPDNMRSSHARVHGEDPQVRYTRDDLVALLEQKGMHRQLEACTDEVIEAARREGHTDQPSDVLMVGGSCLLPGVFPLFEERFGRDRVRAWHPFEAVVHGACALAASGFEPSDFIVHDYAIVVHDRNTREKGYTVIVPAGTRFPTKPDFWRRQLVPTCALGMPERMFKLVISEIGRAHGGDRSFGWDAEGQLHALEEGGEDLIVPLNEANPTLGTLDPPQSPSDRTPRLDVSFGVDGDRWLIATVKDLKTGRTLLDESPVVRLL